MRDFLLSKLITVPAILIAIVVHEMSHGYMSYKLGDPTPKYDGRLSSNPFRHLDPIGTILLLIFGFGWAKPVKVNPQYYKKPRRDMALVALAGPLSNFILAFISYFLLMVLVEIVPASLNDNGIASYAITFIILFLDILVNINIGLMVFNLIPIPPLDGSRILAKFLPDKLFFKYAKIEPYGMYIVFGLLALGVGATLLNNLRMLVLSGINFIISPLINLIF